MLTYIALLRGINVSGQKKIKMAELRTQLENLGLLSVQTYIQSGNVVFQSPVSSPNALAKKIIAMILKEYGWEVPVLVLETKHIQAAVGGYPWQEKEDRVPKDIYLTFLEEAPTAEQVKHLASFEFQGEEYVLDGKVLYFFCAKGYGRAKMNNNFFEKKLQVKATTRNWRTTHKLLEMAQAIQP